jgi:CxxC-x17-CxxC domain-containing protein
MHQGNWKCSSCGGSITELPFEPRSESGLTCRTCYAKAKDRDNSSQPASEMPPASEPAPNDMPEDAVLASEPAPDDNLNKPVVTGERAKFSGNWRCSTCDTSITSLPFAPRDTSNLKCIDCFKKSKS